MLPWQDMSLFWNTSKHLKSFVRDGKWGKRILLKNWSDSEEVHSENTAALRYKSSKHWQTKKWTRTHWQLWFKCFIAACGFRNMTICSTPVLCQFPQPLGNVQKSGLWRLCCLYWRGMRKVSCISSRWVLLQRTSFFPCHCYQALEW